MSSFALSRHRPFRFWCSEFISVERAIQTYLDLIQVEMFYSQYILARKGPLGKIWLAAHFEKKLTKSQVYSTDISESVQTIMNPSVPLALRVSGHLMLGIVRIYSDKVRYLSTDCRDAMTKINLAFKTQVIRVDVDNTAVTGRIDDVNYAQLPEEDEDQPSQIAFSRKVIRQLPKLDETEITSFFTIGDIELLRHAEGRPSVQPFRPSVSFGSGRRSDLSFQRVDDDLPAFDMPTDVSFFQDTKFDQYEPFQLDLPVFSPAAEEPMDVMEQDQFDFPQVVPEVMVPPTNKPKKRRVEVRRCVAFHLKLNPRYYFKNVVDK